MSLHPSLLDFMAGIIFRAAECVLQVFSVQRVYVGQTREKNSELLFIALLMQRITGCLSG